MDYRIIRAMSSASDGGNDVVTASCTLLAANQMTDDTCPSSPQAVQTITLQTLSQKILIPVASVSASPEKQSNSNNTATGSVSSGSLRKPAENTAAAGDAVSHKPVSQKPGSLNPVTRRVRFQAKPNISKNARTR